jgi:excisionase family DNA binding protein
MTQTAATATLGNPGDWLSPEGLAEALNVPLTTVYRWRHFGTGPVGLRIGKHVRYNRTDVDRWLAEQAAVAETVAGRGRITGKLETRPVPGAARPPTGTGRASGAKHSNAAGR